jgi:hypothetical protein
MIHLYTVSMLNSNRSGCIITSHESHEQPIKWPRLPGLVFENTESMDIIGLDSTQECLEKHQESTEMNPKYFILNDRTYIESLGARTLVKAVLPSESKASLSECPCTRRQITSRHRLISLEVLSKNVILKWPDMRLKQRAIMALKHHHNRDALNKNNDWALLKCIPTRKQWVSFGVVMLAVYFGSGNSASDGQSCPRVANKTCGGHIGFESGNSTGVADKNITKDLEEIMHGLKQLEKLGSVISEIKESFENISRLLINNISSLIINELNMAISPQCKLLISDSGTVKCRWKKRLAIAGPQLGTPGGGCLVNGTLLSKSNKFHGQVLVNGEERKTCEKVYFNKKSSSASMEFGIYVGDKLWFGVSVTNINSHGKYKYKGHLVKNGILKKQAMEYSSRDLKDMEKGLKGMSNYEVSKLL